MEEAGNVGGQEMASGRVLGCPQEFSHSAEKAKRRNCQLPPVTDLDLLTAADPGPHLVRALVWPGLRGAGEELQGTAAHVTPCEGPCPPQMWVYNALRGLCTHLQASLVPAKRGGSGTSGRQSAFSATRCQERKRPQPYC